ncbi:alkaline phosphatase family protein [Patescibacteria group bacterium]
MNKLIFIGIDGATWDLIKPWAEAGDLPAFKKILDEGTTGICKSTNPPLTSPGWPAFFTGKNPGKHGVYDFVEPHGDRISNGRMVRTKTLWEILSDNGKKSIVINVPLTFPPRKIDGVIITDMMAAPGEIFTYPDELTEKLNARDYKIDSLFEQPKEKPKAEAIEIINSIEQDHFDVFKGLMQEHDWDFAMLAITGTDRLQHYFWDDKEVLRDHYKIIDSMLAELFELYGDQASFGLISDHGFCTKKLQLDLNFWLEQNGYLMWKKDDSNEAQQSWQEQKYSKQKKSGLKSQLKRLGLTHETIQRSPLLKKLSKKVPRHLRKKLGAKLEQTTRVQDWEKTTAFIPTGIVRGINVNLAGRDKHGTVSQDDYETVREDLIEKLSQLQTPAGTPVFKKVLKREEVYSGPYLEEAYDIMLEFADDSIIPIAKKNKELFTKSDHLSYHHVDGIYAFFGPNFASQSDLTTKLEDITPTILHAFSLPIDKDMDGQVIEDALQEKKEIVYSEQSEKQSISNALKSIKI